MSTMSVKNQLLSYLPHREPMVWVDEVLDFGQDYRGLTGRCRLELKSDGLYMADAKSLRGTTAIELTAQAYGYLKAAYQETHQFRDPPTNTYLTGVRYCYVNFVDLPMTENLSLDIDIQVRREMGLITFVYGEIKLANSEDVLAKTEIQVYVEGLLGRG